MVTWMRMYIFLLECARETAQKKMFITVQFLKMVWTANKMRLLFGAYVKHF